jgi:hypothetical protein
MSAWEGEEASLKLAMELDAQLNGDGGSLDKAFQQTTRNTEFEYDADLAFAMQLDSDLNGADRFSALNSVFEEYENGMDIMLPDSEGDRSPEVFPRGRAKGYKRERPDRSSNIGALQGDANAQYREASPATTTTRRASPTLVTYGEFAECIFPINCKTCKAGLLQSSKDIESLFQAWLTGAAIISPVLTCKVCVSSQQGYSSPVSAL